MRSTFDDSRDQGAPAAPYDPDGAIPCLWCRTATKRSALANYGGRCFSCYEHFCAQGLNGGTQGFENGRADTDQQAAIRKRVKANRPVGQAMVEPETSAELAARQRAAKRETQRKVDAALSGTSTRAHAQQGQEC